MPLAGLVALLFLVTLVGAPFTSARAAIYPDVLTGDKYVMGTAVTLTTYQFAQVLGFAAGGTVVGFFGIADLAGHRRRDLRRVRAHRPGLGPPTTRARRRWPGGAPEPPG